MNAMPPPDSSRPVAVWLFCVAALVLAMVVVGGATRLTGSGLSITEWRPVTGTLPPLTAAHWAEEFEKYRAIPQYEQVNRGMTLEAFKFIYWWEWGHRFLGRLVGLAFAAPFALFLVRRQIPQRLIVRCWALFALGGLQGAIGWWMVASGLSERVSVAPERLMTHLGLAFFLLAALLWTGLEAWNGAPRRKAAGRWPLIGLCMAILVYAQILLGALVAGNDAGYVLTDWPLMGGRWFPADYAGRGLWSTFAHSVPAVQFHHRLGAYVLCACALALVIACVRSLDLAVPVRRAGIFLGLGVFGQAGLGIWTLVSATPLALGLAHQAAAAGVLGLATGFLWISRREG
ncbi:MAG: COX15/CtaA family protein [Phenylobacterium sp.]